MQIDGLPYALIVINKVIFGKVRIDLSKQLSYGFRMPGTYSTHDVKVHRENVISEIEITYPSLSIGRRDSIKIRDYAFPVVQCKFYGTENSIVLKNNKIYFCNQEIENMFNFESAYHESVEHFDMGDVFALSTIFNGSLDVTLISILIEQYKQMKSKGTELQLTIQRYR